MAERALCRQIPKVGAGCPNWARPVLCGGRSEMSVPTANAAGRRRPAAAERLESEAQPMAAGSLGLWTVPIAVLGGAIRVSTPFLFVSLGELVTEKSGRIN